jgi:hypothetical protein
MNITKYENHKLTEYEGMQVRKYENNKLGECEVKIVGCYGLLDKYISNK